MGAIREFAGKVPAVHPEAFLGDGSSVIGDVEIGEGTSIWYGAVVRGDFDSVRIGRECSIQDNAVVHPVPGMPVVIGDRVTVGHGAILHACRIGNDVVIGMGAVVLDGAVIEDGAIVGAGAVVPPGTVVPARTVVVGVPAKPVRELGPEVVDKARAQAFAYVELARGHRDEG